MPTISIVASSHRSYTEYTMLCSVSTNTNFEKICSQPDEHLPNGRAVDHPCLPCSLGPKMNPQGLSGSSSRLGGGGMLESCQVSCHEDLRAAIVLV